MAYLSVGRETAGRAGRCRSRLEGRERIVLPINQQRCKNNQHLLIEDGWLSIKERSDMILPHPYPGIAFIAVLIFQGASE